MTVATTTLTGLYKDVYLPTLGLVKLMSYVGDRPIRSHLVGSELGRIVCSIM